MSNRRGRRAVVWVLGLAVVLAGGAQAQDWNQWRGAARDGVGHGLALPETWPAELSRVWGVEVGSGHASPVVSGERVFVHSREGEEEVVRALDLATGKTLWRAAYPAPYRVNPAAHAHGPGPKSTPVVWQDEVCTLGISGILSCFDIYTGNLLWRHPEGSLPGPLYGTATSPLVTGGLLIAHLGGHHKGALTAFDVRTGAVRWHLEGDGPGYTSPIVAEVGGRRQLVTQTDQRIIGVDPADGALLWSRPFTTPWDQNIVTPLVDGPRLILAGLDQGTFAVEPVQADGVWSLKEVWSSPLSQYMSTAVLVGGRLIGMAPSRKGQLFALDAASGKTLWTSEGRLGDNAALVAVDNVVLVLTDAGELLVQPADAPGFAPVARYQVADSPTWAHPVPTSRGLLIKDRGTVALWSLSPPAPAPAAAP